MDTETSFNKYVLVLKDKLSSYVWLIPSTAAELETVAQALHKWMSTFTAME